MSHHLTCMKMCIFLVIIKSYLCILKLLGLSGENVDVRFLSQPFQYPWRWSEGLPLCSSSVLCYIHRFLQTSCYYVIWDDLYLRCLLSTFICEMNHSAACFCVQNKWKGTPRWSIFCSRLFGFRIIFYQSVKSLTRMGGATWVSTRVLLDSSHWAWYILEHFWSQFQLHIFKKLNFSPCFQYIYVVLQYPNLGFF